MTNPPRVAICQAGIVYGGRFRVIMDIVDILNGAGVVPEILTARLAIDPAKVAERYGRSLQAEYRLLPRVPGLPNEFAILLFNIMLNRYATSYDLLINTNNSLNFLPKYQPILTYLFFPRKARVMSRTVSIHQPNIPLKNWSRQGGQRLVLRSLYQFSEVRPNNEIICMTDFTREALVKAYDVSSLDFPVIYPSVEMAKFQTKNGRRYDAIVTLGRFTASKRQLDQIGLAACMPHTPFHIVGFTGNGHYYQRCRNAISQNSLANVHLYPDAPFDKVLALLQQSKYFLHTLINEPFGITAAQAITAGCVPIVHDSGGQREVVPEESLRYRVLDEVPHILDRLSKLSTHQIKMLVSKLQRHAWLSFDVSVFRNKMTAILLPYLQ
jgi:glycosyltransferase involved in cell wall biosynthesis